MTTLIVPAPDLEPWPTLGPGVCDFLQTYGVHGPGDLRGKPIRLDEEKRALIYRAYEVYPQDHPQAGRRRFKRVGISVRKGWAKTEWAAMIAEVELHPDGPVRTVGWDGHGNPIGGPVTDPYIPMVAYTEEQSDELAYYALKIMLEEGPLAKDFDIGLQRIIRKTGDGRCVSLAAAPSARDGALTTFQIADETHRWITLRLKQAHTTMQANLPKRRAADAWGLEITTAYTPGEGSVAEQAQNYARAVAEGRVSESRLFFFHRQASQKPAAEGGYDLDKVEDLRAAVLEASGAIVAEWSDLEGIMAQFQDPEQDRDYLCRVWLNWIHQGSTRAFSIERWRELAAPGVVIEDGEQITLGFDGSRYWDATALIATHLASGYQWVVGLWERPPNVEEWEVPQIEVELAVETAFTRWQVVRFYADPPYWETHVARWAGEYGPEVVIAWRTNRRNPMAWAIKAWLNAMLDGEVTHDGNPQLAAHVGHCCRQDLTVKNDQGEQERLFLVYKEQPRSPLKIDGAVAAVLSWEARRDAISAGGLKDEGPSVYEERGILVI